MPTVEQIWATQPAVFKEKFPAMYTIIDSEVFLETPSDLYMQSSTWSQYKHHNTVKFLVACALHMLYVRSICGVYFWCWTDKVEWFVGNVEDKPGVSVMADSGFTIKDVLDILHIELNILSFLDGRKQLSASEVDTGRTRLMLCYF